MTKHTIETVALKLNEGVSRESFVEAAEAINDFVAKRDGFVSRRLSCNDDGLWIEHIEWATHEAAMSAAAEIGNEPFADQCQSSVCAGNFHPRRRYEYCAGGVPSGLCLFCSGLRGDDPA